MYTKRLEASVRYSVLTQLDNLKWIVDETNPECNVFQERPKTKEEEKRLAGNNPDFVLYEKGTDRLIGVIEAKRPDKTLSKTLDEAEEKYAKPLEIPLIFAYNDTFITSRYLYNSKPLKIDGEDIRQFIDHYTALRFINEGSEILSAPPHIQHSREQLILIFKKASKLLREAGLQAGLERFSAFSDILFLKIMDEACELDIHAGKQPKIPDHARWSYFAKIKSKNEKLAYIRDSVWKTMNTTYKAILGDVLPINSPEILDELITELSKLNLLSTDTDVKGDAFEYFLKNAYQGIQIKDLGEYFTPRNIVRTMVSMVNPVIGESVYDPYCGTGGFLIEAFKYIKLRVKLDDTLDEKLRNHTVYGYEITQNARVARMNMILFGDGHSNIIKDDSLSKPQKEKYDIVLTNPPYSQTTRYGHLYPGLPTSGDAVCMMHCFYSLKENGRACLLAKEDFLTDGGDVGRVREYIFKNSKNFSIVSLPRNLFVPYTPTKTNIIYFEKAGKRNSTYFYVVKDVGHTLTTRKKSTDRNDLPTMLDAFNGRQTSKEIESYIVDNQVIRDNNNSLWVYDYFEIVPASTYDLEYLDTYIEESGQAISLSDYPDEEFIILGVSNRHGIVEADIKLGSEFKQKYRKVKSGDIVYNPHRVNVGSIGLVPDEYNDCFAPNIYVTFRLKESKQTEISPEYIVQLMKSNTYKRIIAAYDTRHGAVRANLAYDQLIRIKIPVLEKSEMTKYYQKQNRISQARKDIQDKEKDMSLFLTNITSNKTKSAPVSNLISASITREQFHALVRKAAQPIRKSSESDSVEVQT